MQKNTASQKFVVFAFNRTTNVPLTGDSANITANLQIDFGTSTATNDVNPTELEDGFYSFDATQAETNGDSLVLYPASSTGDIQVIAVPGVIYTVSTGSPDEVVQSANHTAGIADIPTVAEFNARTLATADYFDPAADDVAVVTDITTKTGFSLAATGLDAIASTATGMVEIAKAIWDRVLTGATHNINNSAGRRLRQASAIVFADGDAQSGGNNTIQLASGDVTFDEQFARAKVIIVGGTGVGQEAIITSSVASTDTLTITPTWGVNPDNTSEYEVLPAQTHQTVRNGGYDGGFVYVDTVGGTSGTQKGVNGTSTHPSDNLTDAYAIAATESLTKFFIEPGSTVTLPASSTFRQFEGVQYNVLLNSADIDGSRFTGASSVTGIATAGASNSPSFFECGIGSVTLPPCNGFECGFFGTFTFGSAGSFTFGGSASVFDLAPVFDYGSGLNASSLFLQSWGGGALEIQNAGAGTGTYKFELSGVGGDLTINANCSATTQVGVHGPIVITNNASGLAVTDVTNATSVQMVAVQGTTFSTSTDSLEAIRDRGDAAWTTGAGGSAPTVEQIRIEMDDNSTQFAAIVLDTGTTIPAQISGLNNFDPANDDVAVVTDITNDVGVTQAGADKVWDTTTRTLTAFSFTVDCDVKQINGVTVIGAGTSGNLWRA